MNNSYEHWSQTWEANVTAVLADQDGIQGEIDENMRRGDLLGAATASYEHVLTSLELGDHKEAQAYMWMGQMLATADSVLMEESLPEITTFTIPACVDRAPLMGAVYQTNEDGKHITDEDDRWVVDTEATNKARQPQLEIQQAVTETVAHAVAVLLLGPDFDPVVKNSALRDAIAASCNLIFSDHPYEGYGRSERTELLVLAKQLSKHVEINTDETGTEIAFDAFERLMYASMYVEGRTFGTLNTALNAFEEMQYGPASESIGDKCKANIDAINHAKQFRVAFSALLPILNLYACYKPYLKGTNDFGEWHKARSSRGTQRRAEQAHKQMELSQFAQSIG